MGFSVITIELSVNRDIFKKKTSIFCSVSVILEYVQDAYGVLLVRKIPVIKCTMLH